MNFRVIAAAGTSLLGLAATGRYTVIGYQRQGVAASEVKGSNRRVHFYHSQSDFPKSKGRQTGPVQNELTFNVDLIVSAAARVNISAIDAPGATPAQIQTALSGLQEASFIADQMFDELSELVYQTLMDGRNFDLGLGKGVVSNRWVDFARKDDPTPRGNLVVLSGRLQYTCQTVEVVTGDTGVSATGGFDTLVDVVGDDVEQTGVSA